MLPCGFVLPSGGDALGLRAGGTWQEASEKQSPLGLELRRAAREGGAAQRWAASRRRERTLSRAPIKGACQEPRARPVTRGPALGPHCPTLRPSSLAALPA